MADFVRIKKQDAKKLLEEIASTIDRQEENPMYHGEASSYLYELKATLTVALAEGQING